MAFKKIKTVAYPDQHCEMDEYVHEQTGLRHFHLNSSFPEMVFALSLPTPPEDDTGMPHILEHFTLSGSQKYPLKDPFMAMNTRSLAHMMNAATSRLHTTYHYATTLEKDFFNLADMYLDLVFNPLLRKTDFEQEGWRLEQAQDGTWSLKGVVLNEMKGVYAAPNSFMYDNLLKMLAPNTPSARSSGGHPLSIPHLEYPRLIDFHRRYYTPGKAALATSGVFDMNTFHAQVDAAIAAHMAHAQAPLPTPVTPPEGATLPSLFLREGEMLRTRVPGPADAAPLTTVLYQKKAPQGSEEELFEMMLFTALFNSASSPLIELEQSWQCSIEGFYFFDCAHTTGNVGAGFMINGLDKDSVPSVQRQLNDVWSHFAEQGVSAIEWRAAVSTFLKDIRKEHGKSVGRVVHGIAHSVVLNRDPLLDANNLAILDKIGATVPSVEQVKAFCDAFLAQPLLPLVSESDPSLLQQWEAQEQVTVATMVAQGRLPQNKAPTLPDANLELLPSLNEKDVVFPAYTSPVKVVLPSTQTAAAQTLVDAVSPTSSFAVFYDVGGLDLSLQEKMMLVTWSRVAAQLGTVDKTFEEQASWEEQRGVSVSWSFTSESDVNQRLGAWVMVQANALVENVDDCVVALKQHTAGVPQLEEKRWKTAVMTMLEQTKKNAADAVISQSRAQAQAPYSAAFAFQAQLQAHVLDNRQTWLENALANPQAAYNEMSAVLNKVLAAPRHVATIGPLTHNSLLTQALATAVNGPAWDQLSAFTPIEVVEPAPGASTRLPAALMVNYCNRAFPGPKWNTKDAAAVKVALNVAESKLHEIVREHGGAYGVHVSLNNMTVSLSSHRDPHVEETFAAFDRLPSILHEAIAQANPQRLTEAKLSLFQHFLVPQSSFAKASNELNMLRQSYSKKEEEKSMERIREVSWEDVQRVTEKWLSPDRSLVTDSAAVAANKHTPQSKMR